MDYSTFELLITSLKEVHDRSHKIYQLQINTIDYDENFQRIIDILLKSLFTSEGYEEIQWFIYEREGFGGNPLSATDCDGNEICYDIPSLWEEVKNSFQI